MLLFVDKANGIGLPTWHELINAFGPYLGTLIFFIAIVVYLQWYWYRQNIKSKNEEIDRCVKRIAELEKTNDKLIAKLTPKEK